MHSIGKGRGVADVSPWTGEVDDEWGPWKNWSVGRRVHYLEVDGSRVIRLPATVKRVNFGSTYHVQLDDGTFYKHMRRGIELESMDLRDSISDGKTTTGRVVLRVSQLTDKDLSAAGYSWLDILKARTIMAVSGASNSEPAGDFTETLRDTVRHVGNFFEDLYRTVIGDKYKAGDKVEVYVNGLNVWERAEVVSRVDTHMYRVKVQHFVNYVTRRGRSDGGVLDILRAANKDKPSLDDFLNGVPTAFLRPVAPDDAPLPAFEKNNVAEWLNQDGDWVKVYIEKVHVQTRIPTVTYDVAQHNPYAVFRNVLPTMLREWRDDWVLFGFIRIPHCGTSGRDRIEDNDDDTDGGDDEDNAAV
jgi:hypothetical protein